MVQQKMVGHTDDAMLAAGASVISVYEAKAIVKMFADVSTTLDLEEFVEGFTEDCIVRFNDHPEFSGREALRAFIKERISNYQHFICEKRLRCISGDVLGCTWHTRWTDATNGKAMEGRGLEFWIMRGSKIARWDASFHGWPAA